MKDFNLTSSHEAKTPFMLNGWTKRKILMDVVDISKLKLVGRSERHL